jgi:regulator of sirC expression with transglutaminase-like and TPR domain
VRDRGLLLYRQNRFPEALVDLRKYLLLESEAEDREAVAQAVRGIEAILAMIR